MECCRAIISTITIGVNRRWTHAIRELLNPSEMCVRVRPILRASRVHWIRNIFVSKHFTHVIPMLYIASARFWIHCYSCILWRHYWLGTSLRDIIAAGTLISSKDGYIEGFVNTNREATMTLNSNPATVDSTMKRSANEAKVKSCGLSTAVSVVVSIIHCLAVGCK